jgi:hypothetical protein
MQLSIKLRNHHLNLAQNRMSQSNFTGRIFVSFRGQGLTAASSPSCSVCSRRAASSSVITGGTSSSPLSHIADVGAIQLIKCILVIYAAIAHWSLQNHCSVNLSERSTSNIPRP